MIVAVLALAVAAIGTAVASPTLLKVTPSKARKIADKRIDKRAAGLSVASATTAESAENATTAENAANSTQLEGKSLAQIRPVVAGSDNSNEPTLTAAGDEMVSTGVTLTAVSSLSASASVSLIGADANEGATCVAQLDGVAFGKPFATTFDDVGTNNEAVVSIDASLPRVAQGQHRVGINCASTQGTVTKDQAAVSVVAAPIP